jgi:DNA-directed RNA polymerase sigma subunit (sigma70/sigma32)
MNEWDDQREDFFLQDYLVKARRLSLIPNDESQLMKAAREGDENARQQLIKSYLYMAAEIGLRLARPNMKPLDAIQGSNVVLLRLIDGDAEKLAVELGPAIEKHFATFD